MLKYFFALTLFGAALAPAADFRTGQSARATIGQDTFTAMKPGASERLLGGVSGLAYANDMLLVVDSNRVNANPQNHRVVIFRDLPSKVPAPGAQLNSTARCPVCGIPANYVLGQSTYTGTEVHLSQSGFRNPTSVATDGQVVAVADTDNNRVLIWRTMPMANNVPADIVLGQKDFTTARANMGGSVSAAGLRGPQAVWIQGSRLYVADTMNHRVLVWNSIPTSNGAPADLVLGQPDFTTYVEPPLRQSDIKARADNMLNPVGVSSDGTRLFVADLGHNRILVWNSIPNANNVAADIAIGQPDMTSAFSNNSSKLCAPTGKDADGKDIYPRRCAATLDFPRFALSDGRRLFVADGGNDRVLIYNNMPVSSGARADVILGQSDEFSMMFQSLDILGTPQFNPDMAGPAAIRTPMSLAWDGTNLYVSDAFNRRVLVFSPGDPLLLKAGVRNAASLDIFATATIQFSGTIQENDEVIIKLSGKEYKYKVVKDDTFTNIVNQFVGLINAGTGDPNVSATPNLPFQAIILTARKPGAEGNNVTIDGSISANAKISVTRTANTLTGGADAARVAPGSLITILGEGFTSTEASAGDADKLPTTLAGVEVYADGMPVPLLYVSPTQINAHLPFRVSDTTGLALWVRSSDGGSVRYSSAMYVPVVTAAPGVFAAFTQDPRPAIALHESSQATGAVSIDGQAKENESASVIIEDREYTYTIKADDIKDKPDPLAVVQQKLIDAINAADPKVTASLASQFHRIILRAKTPGTAGEGIKYSTKVSSGAAIVATPLTSALCCASTAGAPVTAENPAKPGETIVVYAAGLGLVNPTEAQAAAVAGEKYNGPALNRVNTPAYATVGGRTANVLDAGLLPGTIGLYRLVLQLNTDLPTNPQTQVVISQDIYSSNITTIPVVKPASTTTN